MPATTPATYRDTLARIARAAEQEAAADLALWPMPPYDELEPGIQRCYEAMGAAVAGTVLRDMYDALEGRIDTEDQRAWLVEAVGSFAAARSLHLESEDQ